MLVKGWEKLLEHEIAEAACRTDSWHMPMDVLWVATCVARMTGVDPLLVQEGESRAKAARALKNVANLAKQEGWQEVKPLFAQRGDVVLVGRKGGIVSLDGRRVWMASQPEGKRGGVVSVELKKATQAWRIS